MANLERGENPPEESWYGPLVRLGRGALELFAHASMLILMLTVIYLLERVLEYYWKTKEKMLFGRIPVRYLFDAADLAMLIAFLGIGGYLVLEAFLRRRK